MSSNDRHRKVAEMMPPGWDLAPFLLASEIRAFLQSVKDEGTSIDSGGMDGIGDLWVTVQGIEYLVTVQRSRKQKAADAPTK